jgi:hypothetical protein
MACIAEALRCPVVVVGVEAAGGGIMEIAGLSSVLATGALERIVVGVIMDLFN